MISREMIEQRLVELKISLKSAENQAKNWADQVITHRGAIIQCEEFLKEIDTTEKAELVKAEQLKIVEK